MLRVIGVTISILVVAAAAAAFATDYELKWDNQPFHHGAVHISPAPNFVWLAHDFTLPNANARAIKTIKIYANAYEGVNNHWDGFRIGVFDVVGGVPGSMLWPASGVGRTVVGSGAGWVWCNFNVGWTLPAGKTAFAAAVQIYPAYPHTDEIGYAGSPYAGHSWQRLPSWADGIWSEYRNTTDTNLMLRAIVSTTSVGVEPASLGRVKALFD